MFSVGETYGAVCKEFATRLSANKWYVTTTSALPNRHLRPIDMLFTIWRKRNDYKVAQIDVFSGQAFGWAEAATSLLRVLNKPYILTLHGGNLPNFAQRYPRRVRQLLTSASVVTTPSKYLYQYMCTYRDDIQVLPNPLDINNYPFTHRKEVRPRLVWLRAFHASYNPSLAANVLALLKEDFPTATLLMIGPDKGDGSFQAFQTAIADLELRKMTKCLGPVAKLDVPTFLNRGDIFLNTTNVDNTPVSVMEAMACGLCVVSTNVGGLPYLLNHEQDALLVPPNEPKAMTAAVRRILTEPGLAEYLSCNARKKAEEFDWGTILPQWEELLVTAVRSSANSA